MSYGDNNIGRFLTSGFGDDRDRVSGRNFHREVARRADSDKPVNFAQARNQFLPDRFDQSINPDQTRLGLVKFHRAVSDVGSSDSRESGKVSEAIRERTFSPELVAKARAHFNNSRSTEQYRHLFSA